MELLGQTLRREESVCDNGSLFCFCGALVPGGGVGGRGQAKTQIVNRCFDLKINFFLFGHLVKLCHSCALAGSFPSNQTSVWETVVTVLRETLWRCQVK